MSKETQVEYSLPPVISESGDKPHLDKTVLVTGGSRGIGREICLEFARQGAATIVIVSTPGGRERAQETVAKVQVLGARAIWIGADVSTADFHKIIVTSLLENGVFKIDKLINNAGITLEGPNRRITKEQRLQLAHTNVRSATILTRELLEAGLLADDVVIENMSSAVGIEGMIDTRVQPMYSRTKRGLIRMAQSQAFRRWASLGPEVKIHAIAPGFTKGDNMTSQLPPIFVEVAERETPGGQLVTGNDIAKVVCAVANESFEVTGKPILVDNGLGERTPQVIDIAMAEMRRTLENQVKVRRAERTISQARELIIIGPWEEAEKVLTELIDAMNHVDAENNLKPLALNTRGLAYRMLNDYVKAEQDFQNARNIGDQEQVLIATVGLVDLYRTGNRDRSRNFARDLHEATLYADSAKEIMDLIDEWTLAKVKAWENFGLLFLEKDQKEVARQAYQKSREGCESLEQREPDNIDVKKQLARLTHLEGVLVEESGNDIEALAKQLNAFNAYMELKDVRGMGNCALSMANIYEKIGDPQDAAVWYSHAIRASMRDDHLIDASTYKRASESLDSLPV